ncbi:transporter substrate-binding domain-containing protein [Pseudoalteromonas sp. C2R02]|uniref:substrate-binding periplasmic protein n=1 Tax=Pseudoalteromonas sp. C2R02 TaxID=2841565 RepID=UPI00209116E2|nr:transporter substrate-binding domain-containing protein [Pseudoalteromonas sp. C2R02]
MKKYNVITYFLIFIFIILSKQVSAKINKILTVGVGWTKPPYVIESENSGFEIELIKAIFIRMGYQLSFVYVPFGRSHYLLDQNKLDFAMTLSPKLLKNANQLSDPYITYKNVAISLKGRDILVNSISDLSRYSIVAFQNSNIILGQEYSKAVNKSPFYLELPDQKKQVEMLLKGRVDLVVMDINIFNYLSKGLLGKNHLNNVDVHNLFPKNDYRLGFRNRILKMKFNTALKKFKQSEQYKILVNSYEFIQ